MMYSLPLSSMHLLKLPHPLISVSMPPLPVLSMSNLDLSPMPHQKRLELHHCPQPSLWVDPLQLLPSMKFLEVGPLASHMKRLPKIVVVLLEVDHTILYHRRLLPPIPHPSVVRLDPNIVSALLLKPPDSPLRQEMPLHLSLLPRSLLLMVLLASNALELHE